MRASFQLEAFVEADQTCLTWQRLRRKLPHLHRRRRRHVLPIGRRPRQCRRLLVAGARAGPDDSDVSALARRLSPLAAILPSLTDDFGSTSVTVTAPGGATTIIQYPGGAPSGGVSVGDAGSSKPNIGAVCLPFPFATSHLSVFAYQRLSLGRLPPLQIVGGAVAGVAALAILAALLLLLRRRRRRAAAEAEGPEMTTANQPWDPPVPRDPDTLPPSTASFLGGPFGSPSIGNRPSTEYGAAPPSAFSHVPPGAYGSAGSDAHSTTSLMDGTDGGRRSTEKRALAAAAAGGATGASSQGRPSADVQHSAALDPPPALGSGGRERANSAGSGARFIRHEDAGLVESAAGDHNGAAAEEEVVDLPPLYQDARPKTGPSARPAGKPLSHSGPTAAGRTSGDAA